MGVEHKHPCFNGCSNYARIHLPVAPECNIKCGFCNKKSDCANENRPGVSSTLLTPQQAFKKYLESKDKMNISVVGVAGPGDPLANFEETQQTFMKIRECDKTVSLCIATNGLRLEEYFAELYQVGTRYFSVTINSTKDRISEQIYEYVDYEGERLYGTAAGKRLFLQQCNALELIAKSNAFIKINFVYVPNINEDEAIEVAKLASYYKCETMNIIPMIPVKDTPLYNIGEINKEHFLSVKDAAGKIIPIMGHCNRCRADAAGYLKKNID